jgi:hypothetical protein
MRALIRSEEVVAAERNQAARAMLEQRGDVSAPDPMPFIVGAPRSGTTLLRNLLDGHPDLAIPLETHFLPAVFDLTWRQGSTCEPDALRPALYECVTGFSTWPDLGIDAEDFSAALRELEPFDVTRGLRAFYRLCAEAEGKPRAGDKTPAYARHLPVVEVLLPESHFIHIVRDGRDVWLSAREAPERIAQAWFPFGGDAATLAAQWRRDVLQCRRWALTATYFLELRYEDLLADPGSQLERACRFIDLPYDARMLSYHERDRPEEDERARVAVERFVKGDSDSQPGEPALEESPEDGSELAVPVDPSRRERWRREMPSEEIEAFEAVAGDVLERYGYELSTRQPSR